MMERRYDIDWLRNLGILLLFPFHTARVFDVFEPFYAKNAVLGVGAGHLIQAMGYWFMPLLFLLAGASSWYALQKRDAGRYIKERTDRLLIPLLFGLIILVPPQGYMALLSQGIHTNYFSFLGGYFTDFSDLSGYFGTFTPGHLWFILYLFVLSLAALPLLLRIRNQANRSIADGMKNKFARFISHPAVFLLLFIPLTLTEALPDIGGKNPFFFLGLFLLGYLAFAYEEAQRTIQKLKLPCLIALPFLLAVFFYGNNVWNNLSDFSAQQLVLAFIRNLTLWSTLIVMLGYARNLLNHSSNTLAYMSRAAFPVYVLHQTVLVVVAFFVVQMSLGVTAKFLLIMAGSLVITVGLYELARRVKVLRFLLGIKG